MSFGIIKAQNNYFYRLDEEKGFMSTEVYDINQDSIGNIWIGCNDGLFKYNGIKFKHYPSALENGRSKSNLQITQNGYLLCQNFNGQLFKIEKDSLKLLIDNSTRFRSNPVFTTDKNNNIWIATDNTVLVYTLKGEKIAEKQIEYNSNEKGPPIIIDIKSDQEKNVYLTGENMALFQAELKDNSIQIIQKQQLVEREFFRQIILGFNNDTVYLYHENKITKERKVLKLKGYNITTYNLLKNQTQLLYKIKFLTSSEGYICTSEGIYSLESFIKNENNPHSIWQNEKTSSLFNDNEGNLWISSLQSGIIVIPNKNIAVINRDNSPLIDNLITYIESLGDKLIAGDYHGRLTEISFSTKQLKTITTTETELKQVKKIKPYKTGMIVAQGKLLLYTKNKTTDLKIHNVRDFEILNDTLYFVTPYENGYIYLQQLNNKEIKPTTLRSKAGRSVAVDSVHSVVYFANNDGLFEYKNGLLKQITYKEKPVFASKLKADSDTLWISTINGKIIYYTSGSIIELKQLNKQIKGTAIKTFEKKKNNWYVVSNTHIHLFKGTGNPPIILNILDGIPTTEINHIYVNNNRILLATNKGIISFNENQITPNLYKPKIRIDKIILNDKEIKATEKMEFRYNENNISITLESVCLKSRGQFEYQYRILPSDTNYNRINAENNKIELTSLQPGSYTVEVTAVNYTGIPSEKPATIIFSISKPFWQEWWFYILGILFSGSIIALLFSQRIKKIKEKNQKEKQLIQSQLTAIKAQLNPHFLFNALNSIQSLILENDTKNSNLYLSKFSSLMRKILEASEQEFIPITAETELLKLYLDLEKLRFGKEFSADIIIEDNVDSGFLIPPMLFQPFIENALKHGLLHKKGKKELLIKFYKDNKNLYCKIADNGIGRKKAEEIKARKNTSHQSFATKAIEQRIELLNHYFINNYQIEIIDQYNNDHPSGTTVIITIPLI